MAQNECQQMDKAAFYQALRNQIGTLYNQMMYLGRMSEFLNTMDAATATNMGMQAETTTAVANLRVAVDEILAFYEGTGSTQTVVLKDQINKLRYIQ